MLFTFIKFGWPGYITVIKFTEFIWSHVYVAAALVYAQQKQLTVSSCSGCWRPMLLSRSRKAGGCFVTMVTSTTWSWTSRSFCNVATLTLSWHWKVKLRVTFINIFRWTEQSTLGNHGNPAAPLPSKGTFAKYWRKEGIFAKHWRNEGIFCHCLYRPEWTLIRGIFAKYWREEAIICFKFEYWVLSL